MKAIGGYLEFEKFYGKEYHTDVFRLNTVRNAILYYIQKNDIKKVYIPFYLCHSVSDKLKTESIEYEYYHIDRQLKPIINHDIGRNELVLIVNYFGQFSNYELDNFRKIYTNILVDNTQSYFQKVPKNIASVYTCRKYFGVSDGAYLSTNTVIDDYIKLPYDKSYDRMLHLLGRYENDATEYYEEFKKNDEVLAELPIMKMSRLTQNILTGINYSAVKKIRAHNFEILHENLNTINMLDIKNYGGFFMYPLLIANGNQIKKELISKKIFIPTLWPNVLEMPQDSWEYFLANNLVLLPIDQRYNETDMIYMLEHIKK